MWWWRGSLYQVGLNHRKGEGLVLYLKTLLQVGCVPDSRKACEMNVAQRRQGVDRK